MVVTVVYNNYDTHVLKSKFFGIFLMWLKILLTGSVMVVALFSYISPSFGLDDSLKSESLDMADFLTRPTFGLSHEDSSQIVDSGFKLNNQTFSITNNFHTPFQEQTITIGEETSLEATVFSQKGLRVQEFLFGVPQVGKAHLAEVGLEVWINFEGDIENIKVIQESEVIDEGSIVATHEKVNCQSFSNEKKCDSTKLSVVFLEPLQYKVMAIKAIDWKNRYQITYLNDGIYVSGDSLNPLPSEIISPQTQKEVPIKVTQSKKYSVLWVSEDGRVFERNTFGSFKQIINSFERFEDSGNPRSRVHSGFWSVLKDEQTRAVGVFNSTSLVSDLPESFSYSFPETKERITSDIKKIMQEQEEIAKKIIEKSLVQARFSNTEP